MNNRFAGAAGFDSDDDVIYSLGETRGWNDEINVPFLHPMVKEVTIGDDQELVGFKCSFFPKSDSYHGNDLSGWLHRLAFVILDLGDDDDQIDKETPNEDATKLQIEETKATTQVDEQLSI